MVLPIHKPPGWTPLEAMEALRADTPALADTPMVYAGRLDPMAEGTLLVLTGEDRHTLPAHLAHDKVYEAQLLFGVESDSHDALGRLQWHPTAPDLSACLEAVRTLVGGHRLPLPVWSAYKVRGRPLHAWAREGRLAEVSVPLRDMTVLCLDAAEARSVRPSALVQDVDARITRVRGDFRQPEALGDWARLAHADPPCVLVSVTLTVTSGTYIRALAQDLGARLGCGALLYRLRRTRVGPYAARPVVQTMQ